MPSSESGLDAIQPPRTVYLTHWFPLLSETFVYYEVEGLRRQGFPVAVVSLYGCRFRNVSRKMLQADIPVHRIGVPRIPAILAAMLRRLWREPRRSWQVLKRLLFCTRWRNIEMMFESWWACCCGFLLAERLSRAGVRHVHGAWASGPATAAWVVNQLEGIPFSFTARATDVHPQDGFLREKLADCVFARADSSYNIPWMASFMPETARSRLFLVYNAMTLPDTGIRPFAVHQPDRIIAIGRLIPKKGFVHLLEAQALLHARGHRVHVTIVGSGGEQRTLEKAVRRLGLEDSVTFTGALPHDRIAGLLAESDLLVMPSVVPEGTQHSDGLPTVIIEAMSMGVPVVATDVASISDVVHDGETGRLVPQKDDAALARAIDAMLTDREAARNMAVRARDMVRAMLSPENTLGRMQALFSDPDHCLPVAVSAR